ncbi:MAG: hypothetical protein LUF91_08565 [Oscillospiraceae bacterium]|nr:hypothetical protein [Oscillospiraceae bacterium]
MLFFVADTHFGHANIIRLCNRPFLDVNAMNKGMIDLWNSRVTNNDTVIVVGDMFFRCDDPVNILDQLKGKKRLIIGNHDDSWMSHVDCNKYFLSVENFVEFSDGVRGLVICHFPLLVWKNAPRTYMVHGHIHNSTDADYWPLIRDRDNVLNAGVEINDYMPVTFDEMLANNRKFKALH